MIKLTFDKILQSVRSELFDLASGAEVNSQHPAFLAICEIIALSRCTFSTSTIADEVRAVITAAPAPARGSLADQILRDFHEIAAKPFGCAHAEPTSPALVINNAGFADLATSLVVQEEGQGVLEEIAAVASNSLRALQETSAALAKKHVTDVLRRDLEIGHQFITTTLRWALSTHLCGNPRRSETILRRRQALESYGLLSSVLMDPVVTDVIDRGQPLAPVLRERLRLSPAQLRKIRRARSFEASLQGYDAASSVRRLVVYEVPAHQWPDDWGQTIWAKGLGYPLLSPAILNNMTDADDALMALKADILIPLVNERRKALGLAMTGNSQVSTFCTGLFLAAPEQSVEFQQLFYRGMTRAILGSRGAKAFHEGVGLWHRRAACAAALRHESQTDHPHWPALCPVWSSPDGTFQAVPLTTAEQLVQEGNAHNHCVGGYYEVCRSGQTHIISMRRNGVPVGTLELLATFTKGKLVGLRAGQFEGRYRAQPDHDAREAAAAFLRDLGAGTHPTHKKEVADNARRAKRESDWFSQREPMPMSHAEKVWPLYKGLLPRPFPPTAAQWAEVSGFNDTVDAVLLALADQTGQGSVTTLRLAA
ncbi:PcfJ domain-containing protein [Sphingomonas sp. 3-13AW]|uniref:PcfJ domain-containing protein n=1 Tax=Sphingomonas sp. 3-13AW TaxID=3050450 RepID=UPI003BB7CB7D